MDPYEKTPATFGLAASWILVFLAMIAVQGGLQTGGNIIAGGISPLTSHPFGDLRSRELMQGQLWRALTATFIHYSILHILFNLMGLYQLGRLMESWYGTSQFLGLYVVIGFFGNLLAGFSKPLVAAALRPLVTIPVDGASGGGSGVLCGLIAMLAVVGWRSKSRYGDYLKGQMIGVLGFTAVLGVVIPNIDNFGHAGGAIIGALCGFLDPYLLRRAERPAKSRWIGVVSILTIAAAFGLQWNSARYETRNGRRDIQRIEAGILARQAAMGRLTQLALIYRELSRRAPNEIAVGPPRFPKPRRLASRKELAAVAESLLKSMESLPNSIGDDATAKSFHTLAALTRHAETRRPTPGEIALFERELVRVVARIQLEQKTFDAILKDLRPQAAPPAKPAAKPRL